MVESISMGVEGMSQLSHSVSAQEKLLTPSEVATLFRVDPKTVTRWAKVGKLTSIKTLGGHRRYRESEVKALLKSTLDNSVSLSSLKQIGEIRL